MLADAHILPRLEQRHATLLDHGRRRDREVDEPAAVCRRDLLRLHRLARKAHQAGQGRDRRRRVRSFCRHALLERGAGVGVLDARQLFPKRRLVEGGELSDLGDQLVAALAQRAGGQSVAIGLDPRDLGRRDLVVDRVAQGLEVAALLLDGAREIARLADPALVVAHVEAPLELVGQQVVARLVEAVERQVALEEARRVSRLVLGAR